MILHILFNFIILKNYYLQYKYINPVNKFIMNKLILTLLILLSLTLQSIQSHETTVKDNKTDNKDDVDEQKRKENELADKEYEELYICLKSELVANLGGSIAYLAQGKLSLKKFLSTSGKFSARLVKASLDCFVNSPILSKEMSEIFPLHRESYSALLADKCFVNLLPPLVIGSVLVRWGSFLSKFHKIFLPSLLGVGYLGINITLQCRDSIRAIQKLLSERRHSK